MAVLRVGIVRRCALAAVILVVALAGGARPGAAAAELEDNAWIAQWRCLGTFDDLKHRGLKGDPLEPFGGEDAFAADPDAIASKALESSPTLQGASPSLLESGMVDVGSLYKPSHGRIAYAWSEVRVERPVCAFLRFGSSAGARVWIDGKPVLETIPNRSSHPDQNAACVRLSAGTRRLVVRSEQGSREWGFHLRFSGFEKPSSQARLKALCPAPLPELLTGSKLPLEQTLHLWVMNCASQEAASFTLTAKADILRQASTPVINCAAGQIAEASVPLQLAEGVAPGLETFVEIEAHLADGSCVSLGRHGVRTAPAHPLLRSRSKDKEAFYIVQVSDPHIIDASSTLHKIATAARLKQVVEEINAMQPPPDFVAVTGDLMLDVASGYDVYQEIMSRLKAPYVDVFGNHDKGAGLGEAERRFSLRGLPAYYGFEHKGVGFFVLDGVASIAPPQGYIGGRQLAWLAGMLEQMPNSPQIFFLHHDLFTGRGVSNYQEVQSALRKSSAEQWFFCGHLHRDVFGRWGRQRHVLTTSISYLFPAADAPFDRKIPGYRLIHFDAEGKVATKFKPLGASVQPDPSPEEYPDIPEWRQEQEGK